MALYATNRFAGDGTTTQYEINFVGQYIDRSHVKAYRVDNATQVRTPVVIAPGQWLNATTITGFAPTPVGQTLVIYRDTPKPPMVDFVNGSRLTEYNLDLVARQGLFVAMEALDSNDHEAIDELLAAIEVVTGLVDDATAAVADATQAALEAAASAVEAAGYATQAEAARVAAVAARDAAQASAGNAAASASAAAGSASAASTSASNAAASANTATTQAGLAGGYATSANTQANNAATSATNAGNSATAAANSASAANTSASNAATSATNAANSASAAATSAGIAAAAAGAAGAMCCRVVVVNAAARTVRLERAGGMVMTLLGEARLIPTAGITVTLPNTSTPQYLYASWDGTNINLTADPTAPEWNSAYGQWVYPGSPVFVVVAYVRPDGLATPERFLRNYYNGHGMSVLGAGLTEAFSATWDGIDRQLLQVPALLLPGDTIDVSGHANVVSTPIDRVGDLTVKLGASTLARARNTHAGASFAWQNYTCRTVIQRGAGAADPASQVIFELWYLPISTTGGAVTVSGEAASTRINILITPYKWA